MNINDGLHSVKDNTGVGLDKFYCIIDISNKNRTYIF